MMDRVQHFLPFIDHCTEYFCFLICSHLQVRMTVSEGLTCTFHQQAVAVNTNEGHYITLGDVDKSIVISPDLTDI